MSDQHFAALLGFLFVAVWAGLGFGEAILSLAGAGVFYGIARFKSGDLDVDDVRERVEGARAGFVRPSRPTSTTPTRSRTRVR